MPYARNGTPEYGRFTNAELMDYGIDYLTVTCDTRADARGLLELAHRYMAQENRAGSPTEKGGFQGYVGHQAGAVFFGVREDGSVLRVSGKLADEVFWKLPHGACSVSRLDLQVTIRTEGHMPGLALDLANERAAAFKAHKRKMVPRQNVRLGYGEGDTLYIGSRVSARHGRVYDKGLQSNDERYTNCWRYEVEYKKVMGPKIAAWLLQQEHSYEAIIASVKGQFAEWGIECPVEADGTLVAGSIGRREFKLERSVAWLETQVKPTIERLLGLMHPNEIAEILGLRCDGDGPGGRFWHDGTPNQFFYPNAQEDTLGKM